ncbi:DUF748 domain-containing protein [Pseudochryseolinea flava]|uniref:DUF748 domain-containing protein n=1 Tax=Pseudochryseolinea flava TaxID=2059302 RepID=A0A364Y2P8_9BACT|nr:DUF748 domain-containing protein [Pseudochryseolinea flava]RAW00952.1 hypothetical protein DQQ10_11980 [Pseudochryseolinea flava]
MKRSRKVGITIVAVLAAIVAIRLALPYVILHYANKSLATMDGYYGHIRDIDLAIIRGAYKIDSVYLNKVDSVTGKQTPFFAASLVDLSVEWNALFHGSIVGEVVFQDPLIRFTKDKVEPKDVRKDSAQFDKIADDFMPLSINRMEIRNGNIQYLDQHTKPKVDIQMTDVYFTATNLRNSYDSSALLPSTVKGRGSIYDGTFNLNMKLNPLAEKPTFDLNAEIKNTNLVKLNDFFQAYAKVDVNKGTFGLYTEIASKQGRFEGYVKPLLKDVDILGKEDRDDNAFRKLWEAIAGGVSEIFENQPKDQVATKIPFRGNVENPKANIWYAISEVLQNAFIRAIQPSLDNEINIAAIPAPGEKEKEKESFLGKVFGKKDDEKKKARENARQERKEKRRERRRAREEDDKHS